MPNAVLLQKSTPSGDKTIPLKLVGYPLQLGMDIFKRRNVSRGPLSMLRVRGSHPRFALRGPWACGRPPMHPATVTSGNNRVLARSAFSGFCMAALARPAGPEPRATARLNESFSVH